MSLPLVYHDDYSPPLPPGHRFPMEKFRRLKHLLVDEGIAADESFLAPDACPVDILVESHCPAYVERFMTGNLSASELRRLGFPWSEALVKRTLRAVGGTLLTAREALRNGLACHLAGGTHHAHRDFAAGFCIFNDLAIVARHLISRGEAARVMIIDCDVHQGDGTARMLADLPEAFTLSLHCEQNFPARKAASDLDIVLPKGTADSDYLNVVDSTLRDLLPRVAPDLVLYDAGVDVHTDDALGLLALSDLGIAARDRCVLTHCLDAGIAVAGVLGGGYDPDPGTIAARHAHLFRAAHQLWNERSSRRGD